MSNPPPLQRKRAGALAVATAMFLQAVVLPAYGTVSQLPSLYSTPPDTNVMFTLDNSSSMWADAIPDMADYTGLTTAPAVTDTLSYYNNNNGNNRKHPNMWGAGSQFLKLAYFDGNNELVRYLRSAAGNPLYYDPAVTYLPWPTAADDSKLSPPANVSKVNVDSDNPFDTTYTIDLTKSITETGKTYWYATYFVTTATLPLGLPNALLSARYKTAAFTKWEIKSTVADYPRAATRSDCTGAVSATTGCTYNQELQNFANWLQYYRDRALMAKGGIAAGFSKQGTNLRVGIGSINAPGTVIKGVAQFTGAARTGFYDTLYPLVINGGTPLRKALDDVGKYFQRKNVGNPWSQDPTSTTTVGKEYTCRKSVHILSTDGFWKDAAATAPASGSNDTFSGSTPAKGAAGGKTYPFSDTAAAATETDPLVGRFTVNPFSDPNGNQLSDVAAYYWRNDLRTDLNNDVFSSERDPAFWQHVSTYTVGLGVSGTGTVKRTSDGSSVVPATEPSTSPYYSFRGQPWIASQQLRDLLITKRTALTWPKVPGDEAPESGDDLIHASMSGRGRYLSATNPTQLGAGISALLAEASDNPSSLASVATSSNSLSSDNKIYQATYNPNQWYGRLYAFTQGATGTVATSPSLAVWEASNMMPAASSRKIYTWDPDAKLGSTFTWTNGLTATQKGYLGNDSTLLDYLRGSDTKELAQGGVFRDRSRYTVGSVKGGVLGDVVNGSPIKGPSAGGGYDRLPSGTPGQASYATFRSATNTALNSMRDTIFLGANDGMLHAFNRNDGVERFAYVPNSVFSVPRSLTGTEAKLKMLSDPGYLHRFTVDGPPQIADAFIGPSAAASTWKTVLVGSTGAGARSVFAMDVTNPKDAADATAPAGAFDKTKILWEFSEANNADMGYVFNYPQVARMRDGTWVAIFGNGYDSVNGQAKLFILNLQTGAVVWQQPVGAAGGNGLSQPNFTVNTNREVTAIYAGDLKGNLWKFDVDNPTPSNWKVAFGGAPNYTPLYAGAAAQPITVMPELTVHPNGGWLVSFGTGKLFESEDTATTVATNVNLNTQSIYGVWDKPGELTGFTGRTTLVAQTANTALAAATDANANVSGTTTNTVDWATKRGWYIDLGTGGERVHVNPLQAKNTLLVVANKPTDNSDPCSTGGSSRLFGLDPITGGAPDFGVFNSNGDGTINNADKGYNVKALTTVMLSLPVLQTKTTTADQITTEAVGSRGQTGARAGGVEPKVVKATDCTQWLLAGASNTSIPGFDVSLCKNGNPRVSWRQIK